MEDVLLALVDRELDSRAARNAARASTSAMEILIQHPGSSLPIVGAEQQIPVRPSVLRTSFRGYVQHYDPSLFATSPAQFLRQPSVEEQEVIETMARAEPGPSRLDTSAGLNLPLVRSSSPEPEFRNLLSAWVPSRRNSPYRRNNMKILFESASRAIENKAGSGPGHQYPNERIYSRQWNTEVTALLARRAKVLIYGEVTGSNYTSLLALNREDLIAYFHGNVQRTDHLLDWWQKQ
ncbi:hypothetical protein [Brucella sp. NBRC 12950]|uniref:hypothetical protein n=1 Tax=Brucella sp. NBRC 12950 TaxID=2994518 RepID=UPI0025562630|nr:hypothetical protein [Brucella sp. NBRC 12950]